MRLVRLAVAFALGLIPHSAAAGAQDTLRAITSATLTALAAATAGRALRPDRLTGPDKIRIHQRLTSPAL